MSFMDNTSMCVYVEISLHKSKKKQFQKKWESISLMFEDSRVVRLVKRD